MLSLWISFSYWCMELLCNTFFSLRIIVMILLIIIVISLFSFWYGIAVFNTLFWNNYMTPLICTFTIWVLWSQKCFRLKVITIYSGPETKLKWTDQIWTNELGSVQNLYDLGLVHSVIFIKCFVWFWFCKEHGKTKPNRANAQPCSRLTPTYKRVPSNRN